MVSYNALSKLFEQRLLKKSQVLKCVCEDALKNKSLTFRYPRPFFESKKMQIDELFHLHAATNKLLLLLEFSS